MIPLTINTETINLIVLHNITWLKVKSCCCKIIWCIMAVAGKYCEMSVHWWSWVIEIIACLVLLMLGYISIEVDISNSWKIFNIKWLVFSDSYNSMWAMRSHEVLCSSKIGKVNSLRRVIIRVDRLGNKQLWCIISYPERQTCCIWWAIEVQKCAWWCVASTLSEEYIAFILKVCDLWFKNIQLIKYKSRLKFVCCVKIRCLCTWDLINVSSIIQSHHVYRFLSVVDFLFRNDVVVLDHCNCDI